METLQYLLSPFILHTVVVFATPSIHFKLFYGSSPLVVHHLLTVHISRSHSQTLYLVVVLWTSDQPDAQTSA